MEYKYSLEKYRAGGQTKTTCPQCGRKKCFTKYIDNETNEYLDEACGKCDHEASCAYHYRPKDFFREHPQTKDEWHNILPLKNNAKKPVTPVKTAPLCFIPEHYVADSHSSESVLMKLLYSKFDKENVDNVFQEYRIGATKDGGVIFWQIDNKGGVRSGKIMHYKPDGHRTQGVNWVHCILQKQNILDNSWALTQCFFGEHLLQRYPNRQVHLVESEKTAIICAIRYPEHLWLASGGCHGINLDKLKPLQGRTLRIYPDSGCLQKWKDKFNALLNEESPQQNKSIMQSINYSFVEIMEKYPPNTDIADLII